MVTARGIAENLISNAIWYFGALLFGAVAVLLTYLAPPLRAFAPASYLFAALLAVLALSVIALASAQAFRIFHPLSKPKKLAELDFQPDAIDAAKIERALHTVEEKIVVVDATYAGHVASLRQQIEALTCQFGAHRDEMSKVQAIAAAHESRERSELLKRHIAELTKHLTPLPAHMEHGDKTGAGIAGLRTGDEHLLIREEQKHQRANMQFDGIANALARQGFPMDGWKDAAERAKSQVMADATYLSILPNDAQYAWKEPHKKREWWIQRSVLQAKLSYLTAMQQDYEQKADFLARTGR
jgi:hypothetical protein